MASSSSRSPPVRHCSHLVFVSSEAQAKMMKPLTLALAAATVVGSTGAFAQLPTTKVLTLEVAQIIATEAIAKCRADGFKVSVLVVDAGNIPKALFRDDGAIPVTPEVVKMKATTTILNDR